MKKFFELNRPYKFDPTDLTALIYVVCGAWYDGQEYKRSVPHRLCYWYCVLLES